MLVHQCSSCNEISGHRWLRDGVPELPHGWARITVALPGENSPRVYDLCIECLKKPITFGNIELGGNNEA